jgi:hypothetical protein
VTSRGNIQIDLKSVRLISVSVRRFWNMLPIQRHTRYLRHFQFEPELMPPYNFANSMIIPGFNAHESDSYEQRRPAEPISQRNAQEKDERSIFGKAFTPGVEFAKTRLNTSDMVYNCLLSHYIVHNIPEKLRRQNEGWNSCPAINHYFNLFIARHVVLQSFGNKYI